MHHVQFSGAEMTFEIYRHPKKCQTCNVDFCQVFSRMFVENNFLKIFALELTENPIFHREPSKFHLLGEYL